MQIAQRPVSRRIDRLPIKNALVGLSLPDRRRPKLFQDLAPVEFKPDAAWIAGQGLRKMIEGRGFMLAQRLLGGRQPLDAHPPTIAVSAVCVRAWVSTALASAGASSRNKSGTQQKPGRGNMRGIYRDTAPESGNRCRPGPPWLAAPCHARTWLRHARGSSAITDEKAPAASACRPSAARHLAMVEMRLRFFRLRGDGRARTSAASGRRPWRTRISPVRCRALG